jgi:transcriptional regulator with XRE-family HTH domain
MTISPAQCRAARALLHWSQRDLTQRLGVALRTIADFERSARTPFERALRDIQVALETGGVIFLEEEPESGEVVRRRYTVLGE